MYIYKSCSITRLSFSENVLMGSIEDYVFEWLSGEAEQDYQKFASSLLPNINNVLGVRLPKLRKFAKQLLKEDYESFLNHAPKVMEETMLQGMLIGLIKESPTDKLKRIKKFLPKIDNWSVCDSFCCGLKFAKNNQELVWNFITPLVESKNEYDVRFALVMMLDYFIDENYIEKVLDLTKQVKHDGYYAKMGTAWLISMCYVKFPEITYPYLLKIPDSEVKTKSIRKICESYQVKQEEKQRLKWRSHPLYASLVST